MNDISHMLSIYDSHDRLVRADYSRIGLSTVSSEDFSTQYSYNESGVPLTVKRHGVTDSKGSPLVYRFTDFQGNVTMVTDGKGASKKIPLLPVQTVNIPSHINK